MDGFRKSQCLARSPPLAQHAHRDVARFGKNKLTEFQLDAANVETAQNVLRHLVRKRLDEAVAAAGDEASQLRAHGRVVDRP